MEALSCRTVIVTGSNTGIGKTTSIGLARTGARVIMACRNLEKGEAARQDVIEASGNHNVLLKRLDLASLASVREFAEDINENEARLDILVNNAGVLTKKRELTEDGFEMTFGVNHLGHFYLTSLLLEKLKSCTPSRIVTVSSSGHQVGKINFKDLQLTRGFSGMKAYCRSKTCNILFTVHLASLLQGTGVTVYSLHPGAVTTEIFREQNSCLPKCLFCLAKMTGDKVREATEGAETTLYCCLDPALATESGFYYSDSKKTSAKSHAKDAAKAARLWAVSVDLCGL